MSSESSPPNTTHQDWELLRSWTTEKLANAMLERADTMLSSPWYSNTPPEERGRLLCEWSIIESFGHSPFVDISKFHNFDQFRQAVQSVKSNMIRLRGEDAEENGNIVIRTLMHRLVHLWDSDVESYMLWRYGLRSDDVNNIVFSCEEEEQDDPRAEEDPQVQENFNLRYIVIEAFHPTQPSATVINEGDYGSFLRAEYATKRQYRRTCGSREWHGNLCQVLSDVYDIWGIDVDQVMRFLVEFLDLKGEEVEGLRREVNAYYDEVRLEADETIDTDESRGEEEEEDANDISLVEELN